MDLYDAVAYESSRHLTLRYSTSFGISSRFFTKAIQPHIYAIYGLVRIADEVVDTYKGPDAEDQLDALEAETYRAIKKGYSTNPIVHAFAKTAGIYGINSSLIAPFFASMRMDLSPHTYTDEDYRRYIHGSAEVVGLMCLWVFVEGDAEKYRTLSHGAAALGSAYQKVNFLRDMAADYKILGRLYFPDMSYDSFDESDKLAVIQDIKHDFHTARHALNQLPTSSRKATYISYVYYTELLNRLEKTPAGTIKQTRIRVPSRRKMTLLIRALAKKGHIM